MKSAELVKTLREYKKRVVTISDIEKITGKPSAYVSLILANNKEFRRIEKGKYYLSGTDIYEIASNILAPSYISILSALRYYNLITQMPNTIDVISTRQHKELFLEGYKVRFVKLSKKRVFGYKIEEGAFIAEIEKAIVDSVYLGIDYSYLNEALQNCIKEIDIEKLKKYAMAMDSKIIINKIGFMLEELGVNAEDLIDNRSMRYAVINGTANINSRWRVRYA